MKLPSFSRLFRCGLLLALGFGVWAGGAEAAPWVQTVRYQDGDDPRWAEPAFDDGAWAEAALGEVPVGDGLRWYRAELILEEPEEPGPRAVVLSMLASSEIYWDGRLLGRNGTVGAAPEDEAPGPIYNLFHLPPELAVPGRHLLALRTSSWHIGFSPRQHLYALGVADPVTIAVLTTQSAMLPLGALGALLLAGLYFVALYLLGRRQLSSLLLGLLSFAVAGQLVAEIWRTLAAYPYDWHILRLRIILGLALATSLLLVGFLVVRFRPPKARQWIFGTAGAAALAALLTPGYDGKTVLVLAFGLLAAAGICLGALKGKKLGAGLTAAGVGVCLALLVAEPFAFLDLGLFYGFGVLLACLLVTQALQVREERRIHEAARLNAVRLELELLKRYLQPHFLMNSLTALAEIFEEDPPAGGRALEALAEEIRTLGEVASRRTIPMGRELALCRAHLEVMGWRRDQSFDLRAEGVDLERPVPPAVFHTLVENALTHQSYEGQDAERDRIVFTLQEEVREGRRRYRFIAPPGDGTTKQGKETGTGTGLRYVCARLAEAYGDDWSLDGRPGADGSWITEITVPEQVSEEAEP